MKKLVQLVIVLIFGFGIAACAAESTITTTTTIQPTTSSTTTSSGTTTTMSTTTTTTTTAATTTSSALRVFTLSELATYNGNGGGTAYIAVNGVVYDVTNADQWENGWHKDLHLAGTDATTAFAGSPHSAAFLAALPVVESLSE